MWKGRDVFNRHCRYHARKQKSLRLQAFSRALRHITPSHRHQCCGAANAYSVVLRTLTGSDCWLHCRPAGTPIQEPTRVDEVTRYPYHAVEFLAIPIFISRSG